MADSRAIENHWAHGDVYSTILAALAQASTSLDHLSVEDLAPVDHFHARGFPATVELADRLPIRPDHHVLDIGCGLGGPARYLAKRFACRVTGIDITQPFVDAGNRLTALLSLRDRVTIERGDALQLPYADATFDGAYSQHVTMNVEDRPRFVAEAYRVLKPLAFFAITEHGLGPKGDVVHYPVPWSSDGRGSHLVTPSETRRLLEAAGFVEIVMEDTGPQYVAGYKAMLEKAEQGALPPLGIHILLGEDAVAKMRNAARNIEEGRTHPVFVTCRKPPAS
jgi:SAM-dependent methyltransferase